MEKKMFIQSLQIYYFNLMRKGFHGISRIKDNEIKKFRCKIFFEICIYKKNKFKKAKIVFKEFQKYLFRKFAFRNLKRRNYKENEFSNKIDRFRIKCIKNTHKLFFEKLLEKVAFIRLVKYNIMFLKKKIYLKFFKTICQGISNKIKTQKQISDINEFYKIKLIQKYFHKLQKAVELTLDSKYLFYRKFLIKKILFRNLKENYVKIQDKNRQKRKWFQIFTEIFI
jgi:hypothetical protein